MIRADINEVENKKYREKSMKLKMGSLTTPKKLTNL